MTRLTLLTAPKPFGDARIAIIQHNALASWSRLEDVEILLMGAGPGLAEAARQHGARHFPDVRTNASGTPLISSMIEIARRNSQGELLGIINADIIVMNDLADAAAFVSARLREFVVLARRWDLDVEQALDLSSGWEARLRMQVQAQGRLHRPAGSDAFVFPRGLYKDVPDFAVGRAGWDNWMIFAARRDGVPVVDCTASAMLVHQNHQYGHLPGGAPHYALPETDENIRLAGGTVSIRYTVLDATHCLVDAQLVRPALSRARFMRGVELILRRALFFLPPARIESIVRPKRWRKYWGRLMKGSRRTPDAEDDEPATPGGGMDL